ncbi:TPA: helix-turn-helix transcriptional regulator [Candidatus Woesearchaeota archaeon]|nr:helix-turn-helix transcriptional regulator [Candidatus Woesearchaeota archaeon]HII63937.1 helix-turn-helix transcriptional regulator [Candidatus Woesearchaeota archaeon]
MADKKFLMLSLEDKATKKVANAVSNESCRKILDVLSDKDATESGVAQKLGIPLSTVHYNLRQLVDAGLVSAEEFHYSTKGKEVLHYKLANKYIIITPREVTGIRGKLRRILPITFIAGGAALVAQLVADYVSLPPQEAAMMQPVVMESAMLKTADAMYSAAGQAPAHALSWGSFEVALWFFIGSLAALLIHTFLMKRE